MAGGGRGKVEGEEGRGWGVSGVGKPANSTIVIQNVRSLCVISMKRKYIMYKCVVCSQWLRSNTRDN